jgi:hypothetical protein
MRRTRTKSADFNVDGAAMTEKPKQIPLTRTSTSTRHQM